MSTKEFNFITKAFIIWFLSLFLVLFFAVKFLPLQGNFLGGGLINYNKNPYFWTWGNFDGEHYTEIAQTGYGYGQRAFFPLYPLIIKYFAEILGGSQYVYYSTGMAISLTAFFLGLIGFYKLIRLDFKENFAKLCLILVMVFPSSFYFGAIYTESLFFALCVWAFYFARKGEYTQATLISMFLTSTRFVGIVILPAIIAEWFIAHKNDKKILETFPWIVLAAPLGLLAYMYYLDRTVHDMFAFFNSLALFGEQRSSHIILLPQVFYRYVFKIIPNLNTDFFPIIFTTLLEFFMGIIYFIVSLMSFFKLRLSYAIFIFLGYLIPTFSGSFSSMPRYVLVLFPAYIIFANYLKNSKSRVFAFVGFSTILLIVSFALFSRGFWLS